MDIKNEKYIYDTFSKTLSLLYGMYVTDNKSIILLKSMRELLIILDDIRINYGYKSIELLINRYTEIVYKEYKERR